MSTNKTNSTPLWRELNEMRGQGNWQVIERDNPENSRIPFGIIIPFYGACAPIFDTAAFPPNDEANLKRMKADAKYTALAVNNMHILAEALNRIREASLQGLEVYANGEKFSFKTLAGFVAEISGEALSAIS